MHYNLMVEIIFCLLFCLSILSAAVTSSKPIPTEPFGNVWQLDSQGNYWLFWKFNATHITFETHVNTKGYIGFGLTNNGKMYPSDVVVGWIDNQGSTHFKDCHTVEHIQPILDKSQDWFLLLGKEDNFGTVLKFTRKLDTCDGNDFSITDNTIKVIYSYHPNDPSSFSSLPYHGSERRGAKSLMLLSSAKANEYVPPPNAKTINLLQDNLHVPAVDTHYECKVFKIPERKEKHHMIRYEPVITPGNEGYVHHIVVYSCPQATDDDIGKSYACYKTRPQHLQCVDIVIAWAVGGVAFDFPSNAGFSFNTPGDPEYLSMEIHYNNPTIKSGIIDSSGIQIIATTHIRQFDAGLVMAGAIVSDNQFIPPFEPNFLSRHYCDDDCLKLGLQTTDNTMKVFAVLLHSHLIGKKMSARHIRGDTEMEPLAEDLNFDFDYQDLRTLSEEREIRYGDSITVDCYYDSTERRTPTTGGLSTSEEMCLAFLYYYPRHNISKCISQPMYSEMGPSPNKNVQNLQRRDWNIKSVRENFREQLSNTTYFHFCGGSTLDIDYRTYWRKYVFPEREPSRLYKPQRQCPSR